MTSHAQVHQPRRKGSCGSPVEKCRPMFARVCAVERRRFPVGVSPTRHPLQPEATGAVMEETKWLKPSVSVSRSVSAWLGAWIRAEPEILCDVRFRG